MKKLLFAGVAAVAFYCAPAVAAEPIFNWTGFYAGVEAGGGFRGMVGVNVGNDAHLSGVLGGAQVGYNWQSGNFVTGVALDINASHIHGSVDWGGEIYSATIRSFGTAEARLGVLVNPATQFYVSGGAAFGGVSGQVTIGADKFADSRWMTGWTLGGGVEWAINSNTSAFFQYKYINLGTSTFVLDDPESVHARFSVAKVGVNWKR